METRPEDDARLLREFAAGQSQSAFRTLVERYQDMVYGTARRRMGNDQAASDVAQNVFAALARKAPWLSSRTSVGDPASLNMNTALSERIWPMMSSR